MKKSIFSLLFLLAFLNAQAVKYYVTVPGAGNKSGSSWANALEGAMLWEALINANPGDQFWVKSGVYYPDTIVQTKWFELKPGVKVYGCFAGTETSISQRNLWANTTFYSGDIGIPGLSDDNSYNVWGIQNPTSGTLLDGGIILFANNSASGGGLAIATFGAGATHTVTIKNVKFWDNTASNGAGAYVSAHASSGQLTANFTDCVFNQNIASAKGGALFAEATNDRTLVLKLTNCKFTNNLANAQGGGIYSESTSTNSFLSANILNCQFSGNKSSEGAAIANRTTGGTGKLTMTVNNSKFQNNGNAVHSTPGTTFYGGAIYNWCEGKNLSLFANADTFQSNHCVWGWGSSGGAVFSSGWEDYWTKSTDMSFKNCVFTDNSAQAGGAFFGDGAAAVGSSAIFDGCSFEGNYAQHGGAIRESALKNRMLLVKNSTFLPDYAFNYASGAAISKTGNLTLDHCSFTSFNSTGPGASSVVNVWQGNSTQIRECTFEHNSTVYGIGLDGVIAIGGSKQKVNVRNSLFTKNDGRALTIDSAALTMTNSTVADNEIGLHFSGYISKDAYLKNSIVWGNGTAIQEAANVNASFDLWPQFSTIQGGYGGASGADPLFVDPDGDQYQLQYASPARNAGNNAYIVGFSTDLAGAARIQESTVDRGCYEVSAPVAMTRKVSNLSAWQIGLPYPSPATESATLEIENSGPPAKAEFRLTNAIGQVLLSEKTTIETGPNLLKINLLALPPGIYAWQILDSSNAQTVGAGKLTKR